jgi:hypothetical protein
LACVAEWGFLPRNIILGAPNIVNRRPAMAKGQVIMMLGFWASDGCRDVSCMRHAHPTGNDETSEAPNSPNTDR